MFKIKTIIYFSLITCFISLFNQAYAMKFNKLDNNNFSNFSKLPEELILFIIFNFSDNNQIKNNCLINKNFYSIIKKITKEIKLKNLNFEEKLEENYPNIISLNLSGLDKINIEKILKLTKLKNLDLSFTNINNYENGNISLFTNLKKLNLEAYDFNKINNKEKDLLNNILLLTNLENLNFSNYNSKFSGKELSDLSKLTNLTKLDLSWHKFKEKDLVPFYNLRNLKNLILIGFSGVDEENAEEKYLSKKDINKFIEIRPDIKIYFPDFFICFNVFLRQGMNIKFINVLIDLENYNLIFIRDSEDANFIKVTDNLHNKNLEKLPEMSKKLLKKQVIDFGNEIINKVRREFKRELKNKNFYLNFTNNNNNQIPRLKSNELSEDSLYKNIINLLADIQLQVSSAVSCHLSIIK